MAQEGITADEQILDEFLRVPDTVMAAFCYINSFGTHKKHVGLVQGNTASKCQS